ncbi:NADH-quinone oxidoreductase subunit M [Pseudomonadales bacterium]|nr:NADH-quinone oxidoreductase subunit M [Pseudomonadales bacterium]
MIMLLTILTLFIGGLVAWSIEAWNKDLPRWISVGTCFIASILIATLYFQPTQQELMLAGVSSTWYEVLSIPWIPRFGIGFVLAIDGLSLLMVSLTLFLGFIAILSSWDEIERRPGFFQFNLMWTLAGVVGVFVALDLFLFFFFWEVMLIPMYLLIAIWGHENKAYAAMKFFLFTQVSGLIMLVAILALVLGVAGTGAPLTFNYFDLMGHQLGEGLSFWLMCGFFVAFVVKLPGFPFHTWLPDAHTQAPTAASVLLAGILLKTGAYGLIRFTVPLFPEAAADIAGVAMTLGAISIVYGALLAFAQTDFKRLVAYSSVSHMGFVLVGVFAWTELSIQGSVMQMVAHGLSTAALFMIAGALQHRLHTRDMTRMGGIWHSAPRMGAVAMFFIIASLGMPGLGNFVGEFLILLGAFSVNKTIAVIATMGLITGAVYGLIAMQRVFQGQKSSDPEISGIKFGDFGSREMAAMIPMIIALTWIGVYPQPVFDLVDPVLASLYELTLGTSSHWIGASQ